MSKIHHGGCDIEPCTCYKFATPATVPAVGSRFRYIGPEFTTPSKGTLKPGSIGVVTEVNGTATEANPLGWALVTFGGGMTRVYRPHMVDCRRSFEEVGDGELLAEETS